MGRLIVPGKSRVARSLRGFGAPGEKPTIPVEIDWSNTITRSLAHAFYWFDGRCFDLVTKREYALTNSGDIALKHDAQGPYIDHSGYADASTFYPFANLNAGPVSVLSRFRQPGTSTQSLICSRQSNKNNHIELRTNVTTGSIKFHLIDLASGGDNGAIEALSTITGGWQTAVGTRGASSIDLYVDGALKATTTAGEEAEINGNYSLVFGGLNGTTTIEYTGDRSIDLIWFRELSAAEIAHISGNETSLLRSVDQSPILIGTAAAGGSPYTLTADAGSYTYTGTDATLKVGRKVSAASGTYTYTGTAATLKAGYVVPAASGTYTYTGSDATLTYTPTAATLTAEAGSYTYTGQDVTFKRGLVLSAGGGTYSYTGQDATLTYTPVGSFTLPAESGTYTYTGQDAGLLRTYVMPASGGSYTYTGTAAGLAQGYKLTLDAGTYTYTGTAATFDRTYVLAADAGSYTYTGQDASFDYSGQQIWTEIPSVSTTWTEI